MKSYLFLLACISLVMVGCSSNEDLSGNENALAGRAVNFNAETGLAKKIAYGTGNGTSIPVYWSANDLIGTYSPRSTTASKLAVYKANEGGGNHAALSLNTGETGLTWNSAGTAQSFCAFYPSTAATLSGTEGAVVATSTLPSAQDGTSGANGFMAGYKYTDVDPVKLDFAPLMNVLRLTIVDSNLNVDAVHTVSSIVIKSKEATPKKLSGVLKVSYPSSPVNNLSANSFTYDVNSATGDSIVISGSALTSVTNHTLSVTAYLLPQNYSSLKITVYTSGGRYYVAKTAFSSTTFSESSVCDLAFGSLNGVAMVPIDHKVDLGCPAGGSGTVPLYFASSNLIVEKTGSGTIGYFSPYPESTYEDYTSNAIGSKRDLFGWADITGWKTSKYSNSEYPSDTPPASISGNPSYDIARALLGSNWRLPTSVEWQWIINNCTLTLTTNYNNKGISGLIITGSSKTSATYDGKDHSAKVIFLPTTGYRIGQNAYPGNYPGSGCYWSGTLSTDAAYAYYFNFDSNNIALHGYFRYHGLPVRPVTE